MTLTVESGPRNARSDPETGLRLYTWRGREYPSVTSVRRMAGVPHGLVSWLVARVIDRAVLDVGTLNEMLTRERRPRERVLESNRVAEARKWLRAASTEERDTAAALGTAVHDAAAAGMTPATVPDVVTFVKDGRVVTVDGAEVRPRLAWYLDWLRLSGATILAAEVQVWNLTAGYAGSLDLLCRFPSGATHLVDLKTGTSVYAEHLLQVMAYANAEFVGRDDEVDEAATALLRSVDGVAILHLGDEGWAYHVLDATSEAWDAFRGLLTFATWMAAHPDAASITRATRKSSERDLTNARIAAGFDDLREWMKGEAA
jgi:hypothetical protein